VPAPAVVLGGAGAALGPRRVAAGAAGVAALLAVLTLLLFAALFGVGDQTCGVLDGGEPARIDGQSIPPRLVPLYRDAAAEYELGGRGPSVLAAINRIESGFGRNPGSSSAGAIGWMQFMPATWARYGVDADADGKRDPYSPQDAIHAAANYLHASGAPGDWQRAVFAYNHANWYVADVLDHAAEYRAAGLEQLAGAEGGSGCALADEGDGDPSGRFARLIAEADRISDLNLRYVWGGGHTQPAPPPDRVAGYDCSGAVSRLVQAADYDYPTAATPGIEAWGLPRGPGKVTLFNRPHGADAHVFMRIGNRYWGTSGFARPNGGAGWFTRAPSPSYLAGFKVYHLPGL
jgi:hypothetical protein